MPTGRALELWRSTILRSVVWAGFRPMAWGGRQAANVLPGGAVDPEQTLMRRLAQFPMAPGQGSRIPATQSSHHSIPAG